MARVIESPEDKHADKVADEHVGDQPPAGYKCSTTRGPYTTHNGPFYHRTDETSFWHGVRLQQRHCNSRGIAHGGMLMAFCDGLLATAVHRETRQGAVTVRVTSDFLSAAKAGEWLEGTARVTKVLEDMVFCSGEAKVGDSLVIKVSGVFKVLKKR